MKKITAIPKKSRPGTWEAKGIDPKSGRRKSFYGTSAQEAEAKAIRSFGLVVDNSLYGFYSSVYLPTVVGKSQAWHDQIAWAMDKYILPAFGHRDLNSLTRAEFQAFFNHLPLGVSSKKRVRIVFSGVLNLAEVDEVIQRNRLSGVRLPTAPKPNKTALDFEELQALIDASDDLVKPFVLLCALGLRAGEALGVTRAHVGDSIQVRQQVLQPKGGCVVTKTLKTPQSRRDLPIPPELRDLILNCNQVSGIFVCSDSKGGYLTPNNAARELERARIKAGIRRITPHELRHTFQSLLENELHCPRPIVNALMGKTDTGVGSEYNHVMPRQMAQWIDTYWSRLSTPVRQFSVVQEAQK